MGTFTIETDGWRCTHPDRHWTKRHVPCQDCERIPLGQPGFQRDWAILMPTIARLLRYSFNDLRGFYDLTPTERAIVITPERFQDLKDWVRHTLREE